MSVSLAKVVALSSLLAVSLHARTSASRTVCPSAPASLVDELDHGATPLDAWLCPNQQASPEGFWAAYIDSRGPSFGLEPAPSTYDWWAHELSAGRRFRFADPRSFVLLRRFTGRGKERYRPAATLWATRLAPDRLPMVPELSWRLSAEPFSDSELPLALTANAPTAAPAMRQHRCPSWARPIRLTVTSWGKDYDFLPLMDCDGNIEVGALDRISALARIAGLERPELPLPDLPDPPEGWPDEWVPGVRLVHPRLLWILQRIGEAFPKHVVSILSGYRRDEREHSPHRMGRALDLALRGISNERLFAFCMTLGDVGCGYYPYHPFVHIDVRPFGTPKTYWVDASHPGERSVYVDGWPGVVASGAMNGANSE